MFLSIIIPVFNNQKYLKDCLDSCLMQDIPKTDYEIICIDDCSTDGSLKILLEYENNYSNIHVIKTNKNSGVSAARNTGLSHMQGDYCMFLDGDDFLADNCFQSFKMILSNTNEKTILCFGQYSFVELGLSDRHDYYSNGMYLGCPTERYITNRVFPVTIASRFKFKENIYYGEDEVFSLEVKNLDPSFVILEKPIYYYRKHENSAMNLNSEKKKRRIISVINAASYVREKYSLEQQDNYNFFRERIDIAFDQISTLPLFSEIVYLYYMKKSKLLTMKKKDSTEKGYFPCYFKLRLSRIKAFICKHFVFPQKQ